MRMTRAERTSLSGLVPALYFSKELSKKQPVTVNHSNYAALLAKEPVHHGGSKWKAKPSHERRHMVWHSGAVCQDADTRKHSLFMYGADRRYAAPS